METKDVHSIIANLSGCRSLDDEADIDSTSKADFIYNDSLIIEVKEINKSAEARVVKCYERLAAEAGIESDLGLPPYFLASHTHRPEFWERRFERAIFKTIEDHFSKAKRQIMSSTNKNDASHGVVVFIVKAGRFLDAQTVSTLCAKYMREVRSRKSDKAISYVSGWIIIDLSHSVSSKTLSADHTISLVTAPKGENCDVWANLSEAFLSDLQREIGDNDYVEQRGFDGLSFHLEA